MQTISSIAVNVNACSVHSFAQAVDVMDISWMFGVVDGWQNQKCAEADWSACTMVCAPLAFFLICSFGSSMWLYYYHAGNLL